MIRTFQEIEELILKENQKKRIALAGAQDVHALDAVVHAKRRGVVEAVLIGDTAAIRKLLKEMEEPEANYELIECADERGSADLAVQLIREGKADIMMKGLMQSSNYLKAVLNKGRGLVPEGNLLNQASVMEWPERGRMIFYGDCGVNITPDFEAKRKMIVNITALAKGFGYEMPKVAVLSALETAKESIPGSMDAKRLSELEWEDCIVGGPFAFDNAISVEAAEHKGITHPAAGRADIMIMPDLNCGNIFTKAMNFVAHMKTGSVILGATHPVIMTSRANSAEDKYHSILTAILQAMKC